MGIRFKIAHMSDIHAGYKSTRLVNAQGINLREADGYVALSSMITDIINSEVNVAIVAGDIFHIPTPDVRAIIFVQNQLRRLWKAGIPVYILAGNHDTNDVQADIAASRILHDPSRKIFSHVEPYIKHEITDDIVLHMISHHMYSEQSNTMQQIKSEDGKINILSTHGSCIDPLLNIKLHTEQSPREIVIPDNLINDNDWDYIMLGHIHERGYLGSKDGVNDTLKKRTYYNGSLIRRGFSDAECALGRGWTEWQIDDDGEFHPVYHTVAQRPQMDFPVLDATNLSSREISEKIIANLQSSQYDGNNFSAAIAPILRQKISNISSSTYSALDWAHISEMSKHSLEWKTKIITNDNSKNTTDEIIDVNSTTIENIGDVVKLYDDWIDNSQSFEKTIEANRESVRKQTRSFIELGQEAVLNE